MYSVKKAVKAMNKKKRNERVKNLALASAIGAASGAIMALVIASKSDSINNSLNQIKKRIVEAGKEKVDELFKESKNILEERKNDIKEIKGKLGNKFEDAKSDMVEGIDKHYDDKNIIENLKA